MSARGIGKAQSWGPGTVRREFTVGLLRFEVNSHTTYGVTFGLKTDHGHDGRPWLFSGHIAPGMSDGLRKLAAYLDSVGGGENG